MREFAIFIASNVKQTHMCADKVVKRPEDPFLRVCEGLCPFLKPERREWYFGSHHEHLCYFDSSAKNFIIFSACDGQDWNDLTTYFYCNEYKWVGS